MIANIFFTVLIAIFFLIYKSVLNRISKDQNIVNVTAMRFLLFLIGFAILLVSFGKNNLDKFSIELPGNSFNIWLLICVPLLMIFGYAFSRRNSNYNTYPLVKIKDWSFALLLLNFLGWSMYLLAYEFILRGLLLGIWTGQVPMAIAIAINVITYAVIHIPKGWKETVGTIPMGVVLCYATVTTGSIFTPFILHLVLSQSVEIFSIVHNPTVKFKMGYLS